MLSDFHLLDALTNVLVAGQVYGVSMRRVLRRRARRIAGNSVIRALDHIQFLAGADSAVE